MKLPKLKTGEVLVLRTSNKDRCSYNGFKWPGRGPVEAPDWKSTKECGNGLHGLLRGEGNGGLLGSDPESVWQLVAVPEDTVIDLGGKVKFPRGRVVYSGTREEATAILVMMYPGAVVCYGHSVAGHGGTATAGDRGTATAGNWGTATAGNWGTATAGDRGTATAGDRGTLAIWRWDGARRRLVVGYVGENGIKPGVPYRLDEAGNFVEVTK